MSTPEYNDSPPVTTIAPADTMSLPAPAAANKAKAPRAPRPTERAPGQTLLPLSRVQKIVKADKELAGMSKEATYLISVATEEFIKMLAQSGHQQAAREKRTTVQYKDMAVAVKRADELMFLEEIIPNTIPASVAIGKRRAKERAVLADDPEAVSIARAFEAANRKSAAKKGKARANGKGENGYGNPDGSGTGQDSVGYAYGEDEDGSDMMNTSTN
ncbi:hypothetical protein BOTBODRAFT_36716 [Botryobasidium botryosum FD-172 SS1]|uniref:Transcription factor CBF/NF-Y/archaeal histone domain-containing protein n=1 Tax=Botryobasidium botryosum (strain FD-172 SS1) TaxID=930990 RepID=A0A067MEA6_BOTB1|nr:hypothetical protein BOTBODRAFT_36716 [Botryobasidium botryosum FD-172 SS1]